MKEINDRIEKDLDVILSLLGKVDDTFWRSGHPKLENMLRKRVVEITESFMGKGVATFRERKILSMRFGLGDEKSHTYKEVGEEFGVTAERIRQIVKRTLEKVFIIKEG